MIYNNQDLNDDGKKKVQVFGLRLLAGVKLGMIKVCLDSKGELFCHCIK